MRLLPCGDRAILVELDDATQRRRLDALLRSRPLPGTVEHVPGERTVLVTVTSAADLPALATGLLAVALDAEPSQETADATQHLEPLVIEVTYDGADLTAVADYLGLTPADVVARHTGQLWTVEFTGFAPGFGYLTAAEGGLEVPRRQSPRTGIPQGSVGLAGRYTGVYPRPSPGGWQLVGRTDLTLWNVEREPPALLVPGRKVRFVEAGP